MPTLPAVRELIARLVATPSVSSVEPEFDQGNRAIIDLLAGWCSDLGFAVEVMVVPDRPDKANLIARLGSGEGGLILAGHTDTVPYDEARWGQDPFRLREREGRLYGLGTTDMKGFFALALDAVRGLQLSPESLREPLTIVATADEESSMCGAQQLVREGRPRARFAVIGEPTGLRPMRMHKGIMMEGIRLRGRSGHSSDPSLGNSALEGMHELIGALLHWRAELQQRHVNPAFQVPVPTLNLGRVCGGDNPNRICGECELDIDLRLLPGMDIEEVRAEMDAHLRPVAERRGLQFSTERLFSGVAAFETAPDATLVQALEALTGHPAGAVSFATEAPYLVQLGIETVVLGPGDIDQAHQPDEFLALDRIDPMVGMLRELIVRFCVAA